MSVHWPIYRRLLARPRRIAAVDDRKAWRGIELAVGSLHLADHIERASSGDKVAILLPTSGAFGMAALAGWSLGRTLVPLNYLLSQSEVEWIIEHSGADVVITAGKILEALKWSPTNAKLLDLEQLEFKGFPSPRVPARAKADDLAALLYTSGTSGRPKGVMLTHGNVRTNVNQVRRWVTLSTNDVVLGALPQFHSFGFTVLTMLPMMTGMKVVYTARWSPTKVFDLIREHRPTMFVGLPSMYNALLRVKSAKENDFESFRYIVSGGEPLPDAVFNAFQERFGVRIHEGYGLTETSPVTNWLRPEEFRRHSVGRALPEVDISIVDVDSGKDVGPDNDAEIRIGGPNVMAGYYRDEEQTKSVFDEQGRFRTGDMGRVDTDGFLFITGRIKEMLIVGGENVFPREIEEVLNRHPSVHDSGVVGEHDDMRGEVPVAFVEIAEGETFDEDAIRDFCFEHLSRHKAPRRIVHLEALPRNPTGKIMRRALQERLREEAAGDAEGKNEAAR